MAVARLVVGNEEFLVARAVTDAVLAARVAAESPELIDVADLMATECEPGQLEELTSPSLFGEERIVVLRAIQDAGKDLIAALVELIQRGAGDRLIMTHAGGAKGKAALEDLKRVGAEVVTVEPPKTMRDREQWLLDEARRWGGSLERGAPGDLLTAVGTDLRELSTVVAQLVADAGPKVSAESVATYHRGRAELTGFTVADRAVEGNVAQAVEAVRWALSSGVDPVLISSALAGNLRLIGHVAGAQRGTPESLAGPLKQPPWKIRRAQGWLRRWSPEALASAMTAVANADAGIKGVDSDAAFAVERAVIIVATACA